MTKAHILATTDVSAVATQVQELINFVKETGTRAVIVISDNLATRQVLETIDKLLNASPVNVAFSKSPRQCEYMLRMV